MCYAAPEFHNNPTAAENSITVEIDVNLLNTDDVVAGDTYYIGVSVDVDATELYTQTHDFQALASDLTTDVR